MKLYHVSYDNLGPLTKFYPRVPANIASDEDDQVKRVCVSSRVGDCLRMFPWADGRHKVHVYVTEVKRVARVSRTLPMKYVPDWKKWGREEIWLLNKAGYEFRWFGYVRMFRLEMMIRRAFWYFKRGGEGYSEWSVDPTRVNSFSSRGYVQGEVRRHLEMRKFIRETRDRGLMETIKPRLAKYADDVCLADQLSQGKKPYRVPLGREAIGMPEGRQCLGG